MNHFIFWATFFALLILFFWLNQRHDLLKDQSVAAPKPYSYARAQLAWWSIIVLSSFITVVLITGKLPTFHTSTLVVLGISALTTASARIIDISDTANASSAAASAVTTTATATAAVSAANAANTLKNAIDPNDAAVKTAADNIATAAAITATAASSAAADAAKKAVLNRNFPGENFVLDILSDKEGVSIHRLQAVVFNLVIGLWFLYEVYRNLKGLSTNTPMDPTKGKIMVAINTVLPVITENNLILLGLSSGTYAALKATENR